mgnify:FL=1
MFQIEYHSAIKKDFKKLDKSALFFLKTNVIPNIAHNPYQYLLLRGEFRLLRKYKFTYNGVAYRIAYEIKGEKVVLLILVSTRENFYKELKKRAKPRRRILAFLLFLIFTASLIFAAASV